jgi:biotin carboxyl carrier protein
MTLIMAMMSHRKLKTHQYYLQALIEHEIVEDYVNQKEKEAAAAAAAAPAAPAPSASSLSKASAGMPGVQGEMCNDLRSPMGGKIYNRDCMTKAAMTGSSAVPLIHTGAGIPNINTMIQTDYPKSG